MAIFGKKDNKEEKVIEKKSADKVEKKETTITKVAKESDRNLSDVLIKPRITEKAAVKADEANAYTFEVQKSATKTDIKDAIEKIYKVVPVKVNTVITPRKVIKNRKGSGFKGGIKKAIVFLKKGDKIDFV